MHARCAATRASRFRCVSKLAVCKGAIKKSLARVRDAAAALTALIDRNTVLARLHWHTLCAPADVFGVRSTLRTHVGTRGDRCSPR